MSYSWYKKWGTCSFIETRRKYFKPQKCFGHSYLKKKKKKGKKNLFVQKSPDQKISLTNVCRAICRVTIHDWLFIYPCRNLFTLKNMCHAYWTTKRKHTPIAFNDAHWPLRRARRFARLFPTVVISSRDSRRYRFDRSIARATAVVRLSDSSSCTRIKW